MGSNIGYKLDNPNFPATVYGGLHGRMNMNYEGAGPHVDAVVPYVGVEYKNILLGLSYDVTVSSLRPHNNMRGGFELSLMYLGIIEVPPTTIVVPCIRF